MATEFRRRVITSTTPEDNESLIPPQDFGHAFHMIGNGVRETVQLTTAVLLEFQGAVKIILPLLSTEHQRQIYEIFNDYHKLLMTNQRFVTRSLILTARAQTSKELMESINIKIIDEMIETVQELLKKFLELNPILEEKLKDQRALKLWRNIFGMIAGIGIAACGVGLGAGFVAASGFTTALRVYLTTAGSITVASSTATGVYHVAQRLSELDLIMNNLKEIRKGLIQLTQNYSKMEEMILTLSDLDTTKQDFIKLLKETQTIVNQDGIIILLCPFFIIPFISIIFAYIIEYIRRYIKQRRKKQNQIQYLSMIIIISRSSNQTRLSAGI
ncbi:unnamed protein product [Rotaria sordida]|uniref:Uncharacterized protein n=2 Tax=Rotaria sordida TaxID=392033 RepID=A0A815JL07_9BILA|nr:unnamed protein product [Rotaria sordida]